MTTAVSEPVFLTWDDIDKRLADLNLKGSKIWGIPRGGAIVAGLARQQGAKIETNPKNADVAVDDIIDSGKTAEKIRQKYGLKTVALVNKKTEKIQSWIHFPWENKPNEDIAESVTRVLEYIGEDASRDGLMDTPNRVVRSWDQLFGGYGIDPESLLRWFDNPDEDDEMIINKNIQFYSTCEHHMLPFFGRVSIGYIPQRRIVGLSKLSSVVDAYARRLQVQERLTREVGEVFQSVVEGVGVHVEAQHLCMMARGVSQQESTMVTNYLTGPFRDSPAARAEFLQAIQS